MNIQRFIAFSIIVTFCVSCISDNQETNYMDIQEEIFGILPEGDTVYQYTLTNENGIRIKIINYGGIVTGIYVPDKNGNSGDVVLGFDTLQKYVTNDPYFGAIIGRYANRIARGTFELEGQQYVLAANNGENHLHGGIKGFNKVLWNASPDKFSDEVQLEMSYLSPDGEEGYPGNLSVTVAYVLTNDNELKIKYRATTDKKTVINLTHHSYFNLDQPGNTDILDHVMMINADRFTEVNASLIPTGKLPEVMNTPMDFTVPATIGSRIAMVEGGYDHSYVLNKKDENELTLAARVYEPETGRVLEVFTTEPGIQFYSGNFLDGSIIGKEGEPYRKHFGFCLEAQHFPDSPNQPDFPSVVLSPGEVYKQETVYKFGVKHQ